MNRSSAAIVGAVLAAEGDEAQAVYVKRVAVGWQGG